jgi:hypothetical protein
MNKLKNGTSAFILSVSLLSSLPVNAASAELPDIASDTSPILVSKINQDGIIESYPGPDLTNYLKAQKTFYDVATMTAAAILITVSWKIGEKIGEVIDATSKAKKKSKRRLKKA